MQVLGTNHDHLQACPYCYLLTSACHKVSQTTINPYLAHPGLHYRSLSSKPVYCGIATRHRIMLYPDRYAIVRMLSLCRPGRRSVVVTSAHSSSSCGFLDLTITERNGTLTDNGGGSNLEV